MTVNDYLAGRDEEEMRPFYAYCGLTVGSVTGPMDPRQRQEQYARGIVYTTSKELVADFLRDRILLGPYQNAGRRLLRTVLQPGLRAFQGLVQRGIDTAIVDEADSLLIDEAVTPLIISRAQENRPLVDACTAAYGVCGHLVRGVDYKVDLKYREIRLTPEGEAKVADLAAGMPAMWQGVSRREELVVQALNAREFYDRDKQYVVQDGKVAIVDEFTGRLMANRTWRHGLHQSVEAKEGVEVSNPSETLARLSFQRFFRFFRKLAGMTGTAREAAGEFWHIYGLPVMTVPTNRLAYARCSPTGCLPERMKNGGPWSRTSAPCMLPAVRSWWAPAPSRPARNWRPCSPSDNWNSTCSTPCATRRRPASWPRRANPAALRSPPTWPAGERTSSSGEGVADLGRIACDRHRKA